MTGELLLVRPRLARWVAIAVAVGFVGLFAANAVLLPEVTTELNLHRSDQVALGLVGVVLAGGALLFARPRLRADEDGIQVRNVLTTRWLAWEQVLGVTFPDGAAWARLELAQDEFVPVIAIQVVDRGHALTAIRELRALHREHTGARGGQR